MYYLYDDANGSLRTATNASGTQLCWADYYPFGEPVAGTGCSVDNYQFAGLYTDATGEDGNYSAAHRRYNYSYYRWLSPDPGGRKVVKLDNPQTWNMYAYGLNNPATLNDPSGLNACSPNDKSQSDCSATVLITNRTKDKNGNYNDQFKDVKGEGQYNATAIVFANDKIKGIYLIKTTPSSGKYGTVKAGTYTGSRILHGKTRYPAILLSSKRYGFGRVPALGGRDSFTQRSYVSGAELHKSGFSPVNNTGFTKSGMPISAGCSVIACSQYQSFESATGLDAPAPQVDFTIILGASANGGGQ